VPLRLNCGFFFVAPLRFGFCLSRSTSFREGLRQQGVVLFFALDGMSKLMP
jgi:hypothetical protein